MTAFQEDFLQTIVNVNWGGAFAAVQFQAVWDGAVSATHTPGITIPQLGIFNQVSPSHPKIRNFAYHKETKGSVQPPSTTSTTYYCTVVNIGSGSTGHTDVVVTSSGKISFWSMAAGLFGGVGGLGAAETFALTQGQQITGASITGITTSHPVATPTYHEVDNEVFILDLAAIKTLLGPGVKSINFQFTTGIGPVRAEGFYGPVGYTWTSILNTFNSATFKSFPVTALCLPAGWPKVAITKTVVSTGGSPVPSQNLDFSIALPVAQAVNAP
jgi:hypothetical protein